MSVIDLDTINIALNDVDNYSTDNLACIQPITFSCIEFLLPVLIFPTNESAFLSGRFRSFCAMILDVGP